MTRAILGESFSDDERDWNRHDQTFRIKWNLTSGGGMIDRGFDSRGERDDYYTKLRDRHGDALQAELYEGGLK